ncbi:MAG: tRNA-specific 2-thiouridylase [Deltaproteobacteria bacterium]|nr:tRNA-specific 2-thiouridylase [Deltaproteobacteria bacterium]
MPPIPVNAAAAQPASGCGSASAPEPGAGYAPGRVLVAMSGGVDSACAALALKRAGWLVTGATMKLLDSDAGEDGCGRRSCCSRRDIEDARAACLKLDCDHVVFNFAAAFWEEVVRPFRESYSAGRTPNPCILCNRQMKFRKLKERAGLMGCRKMATGHYARIGRDGRRWLLKKARDRDKDQSYVLYCLTQEELAFTLFPLGETLKSEARAMCAEAGIAVASKPESQDICFVPDGDYAGFLASGPEGPEARWGEAGPGGKRLPADGGDSGRNEYPGKNSDQAGNRLAGGNGRPAGNADRAGNSGKSGNGATYRLPGPGDILSSDGKVVGRHKGVWRYTVGQRKGLGLPGPEPSYVLKIDPAANTLTVGGYGDLASPSAVVGELNLISVPELSGPMEIGCKIRYRQPEKPALLEPLPGGKALVTFREPQKAVAPGQAAVFYDGDVVVGGGTILGPGEH